MADQATADGALSRHPALDAAPLLLSMSSLCLGSSFAKSLFPLVGAVGMTGLRNGLSAVLMTALFRPWRWRLDRTQWRLALLYGVILGGMNLCFYLALARLPVGIAVALEFLGPLSVALFSSGRRLDLAWVGLAAAGVALLALPANGAAPLDPVGVVFILGAAIAWAAYIVVGQHASRRMQGAQAVSIGLIAAALLTVPLALVISGPVLARPAVLAGGLLVAVLCSVVPYPLEMVALRRVPRHVFGVLLSLEPAIGALAGFMVLGERLSLLRWVAIGAVVAASVGITVTGRPPPAPPLPQL
jgi:inner membrane transporter RhtA